MSRPDWDHYFMEMATVAASRGTCDRKLVGALIVKEKQVLATGYNGAIAGMGNCSSGPCEERGYVDDCCNSRDCFCNIFCKWCSKSVSSAADSPPDCKKNPGLGHDMSEGHCVRTVHAEMNAVAQAAKYGVGIDNSTVYTTAAPCWDCFRVSVNAGIVRFVYKEAYRLDDNKDRIETVVKQLAISVEQLK